MIILFYSDKCDFCNKIIDYLDKKNLKKNFNLINIDTFIKIPENITIVPTIIDPTIEAPLEGRKAFEFIINQKFFYHPTNNIEYWVNNTIPKPVINDDFKAIEKHNFNFSSFDDKPIEIVTPPIVQEVQEVKKVVINKQMLTLLRLRR